MALTTYLENLIAQGKAKYLTAVVGASGTADISVPDNHFIIITDFDYWYFVDEPPADNGKAAVGYLDLTSADPALVDNATIDLGGVLGTFPAVVDFADPIGTELQIQTGVDTLVTGWTVSVSQPVPGQLVIRFITSAPGDIYNGLVPGYTSTAIIPPVAVPIPYAGGTAAVPITPSDYLTRRTRQLTFRSQNASNHFIINEKIDVVFYAADTDDFYVNVNGFYHKDTYLMHKYNVRVNIHTVPPTKDWSTVYGALDSKSNEPNQPQGYGQLGGGLPVVQQVLFDAATEQYLPLRDQYSSQTLLEYTPEFDTKCVSGRELQDPTNDNGIRGARRTYPLVNIGFVLISGNYSQYFVNG